MEIAPTRCTTPFGTLELHRRAADRSGTLQAWDGADLLLLDLLHDRGIAENVRLLIIDDAFGALTVALASRGPVTSLVDSAASRLAVVANLQRNGVDPSRVTWTVGDGDTFDAVVLKVPRANELLRAEAERLAGCVADGGTVLAAGMDKWLPPTTSAILGDIGTVTTHPGRRKGHAFEVIVHDVEGSASVAVDVRPVVDIPEFDLQVHGAPGVFSSERLDLGTRLLALEVLKTAGGSDGPETVADLGCGTGVLGVLAMRHWPQAQVHFADDSARAVAAARDNVIATFGDERRASFWHRDVFAGVHADIEFDLILCNPPFHHANATDDEVAWQMFLQSRDRLVPGGELWVVGNRHLAHHAKLRRLFGNANVHQLAAHPKFVVLSATAP